jgi:hypothetical protein
MEEAPAPVQALIETKKMRERNSTLFLCCVVLFSFTVLKGRTDVSRFALYTL